MPLRATIWQFATRDGGVDVMHEIPGGRPYSELSERALHVDVAALTDPAAEIGE
jgi:hypothetical protein